MTKRGAMGEDSGLETSVCRPTNFYWSSNILFSHKWGWAPLVGMEFRNHKAGVPRRDYMGGAWWMWKSAPTNSLEDLLLACSTPQLVLNVYGLTQLWEIRIRQVAMQWLRHVQVVLCNVSTARNRLRDYQIRFNASVGVRGIQAPP